MAYTTIKEQKEADSQLLNNWSWLTEGIEDKEELKNTAIVLQNSYEKTIAEGQVSNGWLENVANYDAKAIAGELTEEEINEGPMKTGAIGQNVIPKVLFPVIRRVMPGLIANQLVSVQPITASSGVIYNITYTYSDSKGNVLNGDEYAGIGATAAQGQGFSTFYSSEKIGPFEGTVAADGGNTTIDIDDKVKAFLGTDANAFKLKRIEVYNKTTGVAYATVLDAVSANIVFSESGSNVGYDLDAGDVVLKDAAASVFTEGDNVILYVVYDQEGTTKIPEMEFSIGSQPVSTTERKLKVRWTKEAEQDMKAYHKIDVESELVKVASMEMNYEIDRELIKFIGDIVPTNLSFIHEWEDDAANNTTGNYLDRHRALSQKLSLIAARMAQYNRQGPASWMLVSPQVASIIAMLPNFDGEIAGNSFNIFQAGKLKGGMKVYVDPNRTGGEASEVLLGYKSNSTAYGAGVVYSPYANWMSNTVTDVSNFNSVRGFFSRYAITKVIRGEYFYGKLTINGLVLI